VCKSNAAQILLLRYSDHDCAINHPRGRRIIVAKKSLISFYLHPSYVVRLQPELVMQAQYRNSRRTRTFLQRIFLMGRVN